jgi:hypothetical protein
MPLIVLPNTNIATITVLPNGKTVEANAPTSLDAPKSGTPFNTPQNAFDLGEIVITTNKKRDHVCDFELEMLKNINLSKYTTALANVIREAVRKLLATLGLTDSSGETTYWINLLKNIARELRDFNKYILQPIIDFEKYVLAYIVKLRELVAWLLSLPAKLAKLLADCLARIKKLIVTVFTDIIASAAAVGSGADPNAIDAGLLGSDSAGFADVIAEAKDAVAAAGEVLNKVGEAAQLGATIPLAATAGLLVAATPAEIEAANATILSYEAEKNTINNSAVLSTEVAERPTKVV